MGVVLDKTDPDGLKQMTMQERQAYRAMQPQRAAMPARRQPKA